MTETIEDDTQRKRARANSPEGPASTTISHPSKRPRIEDPYHIINVQNHSYAALLSDNDRSDVVSINYNDRDIAKPGSEWFIIHLWRNEYRIQNSTFSSFVSHDSRPHAGAEVLGKWANPSVWIIKPVSRDSSFYTISPSENPDVFWMSSSSIERTPLELGKPWTAGMCQWIFRAVGSDTGLSPVVPDDSRGHILVTQIILQKLPSMDPNPIRLAFELANIVREITEVIKDNLDAVEQRIVSTAARLTTALSALIKSKADSTRSEIGQWTSQFKKTLQNELGKLYALKEESMSRRSPNHVEDRNCVSNIFEHIDEARMQFELAIGMRVYRSLYEMEADLRKSLLNDLKPSKIADHKYYLEGDEGKLLRRIACTPGTRVRLLDNIITWAKNADSDSPTVYWLFGPAGSGKSTIAYTLARRFEFAGDSDGTIVLGGNFFCSRQFEETKQAKRIVRTIAYHLALVCKAFAGALSRSGAFDSANHDTKSQIQHLLVKPWRISEYDRMNDSSLPSYYLVVIDALDEIDGKGGSNFLRDLFDAFNEGQLVGLKVLATSRQEPSLVAIVCEFKQNRLYRLQDVAQEEVSDDIRTYLAAELPDLVSCQEMERLVASADGLFIHAATVVRYLAGYSVSEQEELLERLLAIPDSAIPRRLDEDSPLLDKLYLEILTRSFRGLDEIIRTRRLRILHTFLCAAERTSYTVVAHLLCDSNKIDSYIQGAAAVVEKLHAVLYTENGLVLSYHKSFSDFLFNQSRSQVFWCDRATQHQLLTESCFRKMNAGLKFNLANIPSSYIVDHNNSALLEEIRKAIPDVLSYSCRNWSHHLCFTTAAANLRHRLLSTFIELRALFWIEALNLLGLRGQCDPTLRTVADWVNKIDLPLADKFAEAANFALYFSASPASLSTPHLYISSLATWPGKSEPLTMWKRLFPRIPAFNHGVEGGGGLLMTLKDDYPVTAVAVSSDNSRIVSCSYGTQVLVWGASMGNVLNVLEGHTESVNSVSFSPDGNRIASGSDDKSVRVWDATEGKKLSVLDSHTDIVNSVAFACDSIRIVSCSRDKSVRIWNTSTGALLEVLSGHTMSVNSVTFSGDGSRIVSGSQDKSVRLWSVLVGETLKVLRGHSESVNSVAFSPDGSRIASGSRDNSVRVWDTSTGGLLTVLDGHTDWVRSVAFSPDGNRIVSAGGRGDRLVRLWDASTGKLHQVLVGHTDRITSVVFSSDGNRIVSGSLDKSVRVWDATAGVIHNRLPDRHTSWVRSVTFSRNDNRIVSGSEDQSIRVWDALTGESIKVLLGHNSSVGSVAFSSHYNHIVSGSDDNSLRIWNAATRNSLNLLHGHTHQVNPPNILGDGGRIVLGSVEQWEGLRAVSNGDSLKVLHGHTHRVNSVNFSSNGSRIASGSVDQSVRVWNASTGKSLHVLHGHTRRVNSVDFSNNGSLIASGSDDKSVRIWDSLTGEPLKVLLGHTHKVNSVAFLSDDSGIVSGSADTSLRMWDASTGNLIKVLNGHTSSVHSVALSKDGSRIASGSYDCSVRIWNVLTGDLLEVLHGHTHWVCSVAFSSDGHRIVSGSYDKSVRVWDAAAVPRYIREHYLDHITMERTYTGWLLSPSGKNRLMFVPLEAKLPDSSTILTIPRSAASSVDFTHADLGLEWHTCYCP